MPLAKNLFAQIKIEIPLIDANKSNFKEISIKL